LVELSDILRHLLTLALCRGPLNVLYVILPAFFFPVHYFFSVHHFDLEDKCVFQCLNNYNIIITVSQLLFFQRNNNKNIILLRFSFFWWVMVSWQFLTPLFFFFFFFTLWHREIFKWI